MKFLLPLAIFAALIATGCSSTTEEPKKEATATEGKPAATDEAKKPEEGAKPADTAATASPFKNIVVTDEAEGKDAKASLAHDAEKLYVNFTLTAKKGDKFGAALYVDKTEEPKMEGKAKEDEKEMPGDGEGEGSFAFLKPDKGWPAGDYHIDLTLNGEVKETAKFSVQ